MEQIKNRFTLKLICEDDCTKKELAEKNKANLRGADLWGADLRGANLWEADLRGANLWGANLWGANLREADLWGANLREADLREADLRGANLREADLRGANLRGANLWGANLWEADLWGANLEFFQFPSVQLISSIRLNNLSENLQVELMRRDAFGHPHPELFDEWQKTGKCPYQNEERFWLFEPNPKLWKPGLPEMTDRDLIIAICRNQGWGIKNYLPKKGS